MPYKAQITASEQTTYDGTPKTTRSERIYDGFGNVTDAYQLGDIATSADDKRVNRAFAYNTTAYIIDKPSYETHYRPDGGIVAQTYFMYDGGSYYSVPSKGDVTAIARRLDAGPGYAAAYPIRAFNYDNVGNKIAEIDEVGNRTEWSYDATYKLFPVQARNPLYFLGDTRQKTSAAYNPICQQPVSTTDIDSLVTAYAYDVFCRATTVTKPGGQSTYTYRTYEGIPGWHFITTMTTPPDGVSYVYKRQWPDGFGRTWYQSNSAPYVGAAEGDAYVRTEFTLRGKPLRISQPFYYGATPIYTTFRYDALDRPIETKSPDNTTATLSYGSGGTTATGVPVFAFVKATDELGRHTIASSDAHGRTIETTRYLGISFRSVFIIPLSKAVPNMLLILIPFAFGILME